MSWLLPILGMVFAFFLIYKRQMFGDMIGEADWMLKVGGVYNLMVIVGLFLFFWCVATLTGTTYIFFTPILWLLPGAPQAPQ